MIKDKKNVGKNKSNSTKNSKNINKKRINKKSKVTFILVVDYMFLASLVFSVIFGIQTNSAFWWPFTIMLAITIICMIIILINAIYVRIFKKVKNIKEKLK